MHPNQFKAELQIAFQPVDKDALLAVTESYQALRTRVDSFLNLHSQDVFSAPDEPSGIVRSFRYTQPAPPELIKIVQQGYPSLDENSLMLDMILSAFYINDSATVECACTELVTRVVASSGGHDGSYTDVTELFHRVETTDEILDNSCLANQVYEDLGQTYPTERINMNTPSDISGINAGITMLEELLAAQS